MIRKMLWKEARESAWKFMILTGALLTIVGIVFYSATSPMDCAPWLVFGSAVATVWIAAGSAATERRAGSLNVLLALPVRPVTIFAVKSCISLLTVLVPFALAAVAVALKFPELHSRNALAECLCAIVIPIPLYFSILAAAAGSRQESRAAMIGALELLVFFAWVFFVILLFRHQARPAWYLFVPNPFFVLLIRDNPRADDMIPVQLLITLFWLSIAAVRFLRTATNTGTGSEERHIPITRTLVLPLEYSPLLWKEIREQIGVLAIAFWSAIGVAVIAGLITCEEMRHENGRFLNAFAAMLQVMLIAGGLMPLLISIVLGVGAFSGDLEDRLLHFWRGQPIPTHLWFWTKYLVSAVGIFLLLVLPLSVAAGGITLFDLSDARFGLGNATQFRQQAWTIFIAVLIILPFAHALSIFFVSIIRRPMYATILALIVLAAVAFIPIFTRTGAPVSFSGLPYCNLAEILSNPGEPASLILTLFAISLILAALLLTASRRLLSRNWRLA
ncbi:MAG TPA: hypothetical protein VM008_21520 [Phycisphaerae bacterium]|nr:hypothetical protein [Phycisphaerae bacterium]